MSAINPESSQSLIVECVGPMGQVLSTATAFLVARESQTWLVTNWHVVAGRDTETNRVLDRNAAVPTKLRVFHSLKTNLGTWAAVEYELYDSTGDPLWMEHPRFGRRVDVVALPVSTAVSIQDTAPYAISADRLKWYLGPTQSVVIVGFPFGRTAGKLYAIWVKGSIASEPEVDPEGLPCLYVDSRTRPGQSGSPVLDFRVPGTIRQTHPGSGSMTIANDWYSELVGVYSGRISEESDIGRVWKRSALIEVVDGKARGPLP